MGAFIDGLDADSAKSVEEVASACDAYILDAPAKFSRISPDPVDNAPCAAVSRIDAGDVSCSVDSIDASALPILTVGSQTCTVASPT